MIILIVEANDEAYVLLSIVRRASSQGNQASVTLKSQANPTTNLKFKIYVHLQALGQRIF